MWDECMIVVGASLADGNGFVENGIIVPVGVSSDGKQILLGIPSHTVNGEVEVGHVYHLC